MISERFVSNNLEVCIIRELHPQTAGSERTPLLNEYNCPLLLMTSNLYILSTSRINKPVSIIHVCSDMCRMDTTYSKFEHDLSNKLYCYNIYCIGNN